MFRILNYDLRRECMITRFIVALLVYLIGGFPTSGYALPKGGVISSGAGTIESSGSSLTVTQATDKIVIDWESFSVGNNESVIFLQPNSNSSALNNILGNSRTVVEGNLSANGQIVLSNPNGIYISPTAKINVASLIASTLKISEQDFIDGLYKFSQDPSKPLASILNEGKIHASEFAALIAPSVNNKGVVVANLGTVGIASGEAVTVDFVGNDLIAFAIDKPVEGQVLDKDGNLINDRISNSGSIQAKGGQAILTARNASEIIKNVINMEGSIEAHTVVKKDGRIFLGGGDEGNVNIAGNLNASGEESGDSGGEVFIQGASVILDKSLIQAIGKNATGGDITITGTNWLSVGGQIDVSGDSGGNIKLTAGGLSIAAPILAQGSTGQGGSININTLSRSWENVDAVLDVSGATGGSIQHFTGQQITTSGKYLALGNNGKGGSIDVTASALKFMSNTIDASGTMGGGTIRLGGEYQGGKNLDVDEIKNAETLLMTDAAQITAKTTGTDGNGGRIIVWADQQAAVFGQLDVTPGTQTGAGGFVEVSSADILTFGAKVLTGIENRTGTLLLDPKNITIASSGGSGSGAFSLAAMMGHGYSGGKNFNQSLDNGDVFGSAVSLDGNRLAVGTAGWSSAGDGKNNSRTNSGEVYLYSFTDSSFSGATLEAMIGHGYTGGKNINQSLGVSDFFGTGVSLDGNRLVVGAWRGEGSDDNRKESGDVYLYTFSDSAFSGGALAGMIGHGYTGGKNINQTLDPGDRFGYSVSLDGNRLAVGSYYGDGLNNQQSRSGEVRLYTFTDSVFSGGELAATIGDGYTGGKNFNQNLDSSDVFSSVSLDGNRLVVGARWADGHNNSQSTSGDVYLFTFSDSVFSNPTLAGMIGDGYTGGKNVNLNLDTPDNNGVSVSLDGNMLAVGCMNCYGHNNNAHGSGQAFIFTFTDSVFSGGQLDATIGHGFTGGKNVNQSLDNDDFGWNVALDNNRLVVGARQGDGNNNSLSNSGDVYLYTAAASGDAVSSAVFATNSSSNSTITPNAIMTLLSAATNVVLQANNDITVSEAITANNSGGDGGDLTLQAGRSVLVNANITTDNGDLTLIANDVTSTGSDGSSNGVVDAQRDSGAAVITLASGTTMNTGTGVFNATIKAGTGKTNRTSGDITLSNVTAGSLVATNNGPTAASDIFDNGVLTISGTSSFTTSASNGDIVIDSTTNAFTGAISLNISDDASIDGGTTALNIATSSVAGNLTLRSGNASGITDSGTVTVGENLSATTDANNGVINFGTLAVDGTVALATNGSGNATVVNDDDLDFATSTVGGNLTATVTTGNIRAEEDTPLTISGTSSFTTRANNGVIVLNGAFTGAVSLNTTGSAGIAAILGGTTALNIAASSIGGPAYLVTGNNITDSGTVTVGSNLIVYTTANNGAINLGTLAVDGKLLLYTHGSGNATVVNDAGLDFIGSRVGGALTATATTGNITDTQNYNVLESNVGTALIVGGPSSFTTSASNATITLDDNTNALTGAVALSTRGTSGNATVDNGTTALNIATSSVGGNLTLTSGNASGITDIRSVNVGGNLSATTDANNGVINLDTLAVDGTIALATHGTGNATVVNDAGLNFAASTVGGNLSATATTGNITDSAPLSISGTSSLTTIAQNADIIIDNTTRSFIGAVSLNTTGRTGHATLDNGTSALNIGASSVGGNMTLISGNRSGIWDSGKVTVGGNLSATTDANSGMINLGTLAVDGMVSLTTHGKGNATVLNETSLRLVGGSFIGGDLKANSKTGRVTTLGNVTVMGTSNLPKDKIFAKKEKLLKQMTVLVAVPMAPPPTASPSFSGGRPGGMALPVPGPRSVAAPTQSAPLIGFSSKAAAAPTAATPAVSPTVKPAGGSPSPQPVRASSAKPAGGSNAKPAGGRSGGKSEGGGPRESSEGGGSGGKSEGGGPRESSEGGGSGGKSEGGGPRESSEGGGESGESSEGGGESGESSEEGSSEESSEDDEEKEE